MYRVMRSMLLLCFSLMTFALIDRQMALADDGIYSVSHLGGEINALAKEGNYLFIGESTKFIALDVTDLSAPMVVKEISLSDIIEDIYIADGIAYVAMGYRGIEVIDVRSPLFMKSRGHYAPDGLFSVERVYVVGQTIYIGSNNGFTILQENTPSQFSITGSVDFPTNRFAMDIEIQGNTAYMANADIGLMLIDIADPSNPTVRSVFDTPGNATNVEVVDSLAYVADNREGFHIINVTNADAPVLLASLDTDGFANSIEVEAGMAYIADSYVDGLLVVDVENPTNPSIVGSYNTRGQASDILVVDGIAYVADGGNGLQLIDVSVPNTPLPVGVYNAAGFPWGLDVEGNLAFLANFESGIHILDVSDASKPLLVSDLDTQGESISVEQEGHYLYVADSRGVEIVDVSEAATPQSLTYYDAPSQHIRVIEDRAYIPGGSTGLHIVNVTNPSAPTLLGIYNTNEDNAKDIDDFDYVQVVDDRAYVAAGHYLNNGTWQGGTVHIIDVANPSVPTPVSIIDTPGVPYQVAIAEDHLFVAADEFRVYDISNEISPTLVTTYTDGSYSYARSVHVVGDLALVGGYGVDVFDISDPADLVQVASTRDCKDAKDIRVIDQVVYMACTYDGFHIAQLRPEYFRGETTIEPSGGSFQSYDKSILITLPENAITDTVTLRFSSSDLNDLGEFAEKVAVRSFGISAVSISSGQRISQVLEPYTVKMNYTNQQIAAAAVDEESLEIVYWAEEQWQPLPPCEGCNIDTAKNQVTIVSDEFAYFSLIGDTKRIYSPLLLEHLSR